MARAVRVQTAGGHFHVTARAIGGEPLFHDDTDRLSLLMPMDRIVRRLGWSVWAYCLMTTHYHLVIETPSADLARGIQYVNGSYAQGYNQR